MEIKTRGIEQMNAVLEGAWADFEALNFKTAELFDDLNNGPDLNIEGGNILTRLEQVKNLLRIAEQLMIGTDEITDEIFNVDEDEAGD